MILELFDMGFISKEFTICVEEIARLAIFRTLMLLNVAPPRRRIITFVAFELPAVSNEVFGFLLPICQDTLLIVRPQLEGGVLSTALGANGKRITVMSALVHVADKIFGEVEHILAIRTLESAPEVLSLPVHVQLQYSTHAFKYLWAPLALHPQSTVFIVSP